MVQSRARAKRRVLDSSDNDEEHHPANVAVETKISEDGGRNGTIKASLPTRPTSKQTTLAFQQSTTASPSSSAHSTPKKPKPKPGKSKTNGNAKAEAKELYSFFNATTQRQQQTSRSPQKKEENEPDLDDQIEDEPLNAAKPRRPLHDMNDTHAAQPMRKRSWDVFNEGPNQANQARPSQKIFKDFTAVKPPSSATSTKRHDTPMCARPWTDEYAPTRIDEVAVHHKKVADVRRWLEGVLEGQIYQRLLVLKGGAGSGKTAVLSLLAQQLKCSLSEWKAPDVMDYEPGSYVSMSAQFEDFLSRAGTYRGLQLVSEMPNSTDGDDDKTKTTSQGTTRQIIVVEEFPDISGSSMTLLQSFRSSVLGYLVTNTSSRFVSSSKNAVPLVMIVSESTVSNGNSSDNFTAHRLLGPEVMHHPGTAIIEFNAVATTFVTKALKLTLDKHAQQTGKRYSPSQEILKKLADIGDIRNAVSALELVCTQLEAGRAPVAPTSKRAKTGKTKAMIKSKINGSSDSLDKSEEALLASVSLRESTLGLFHAVGKVVYNKRNEESFSDSTAQSPNPDTANLSRPALTLDLDSLLDSTGTDPSTFLSALHENYLPSCVSPSNDSEATLTSIVSCLDALTDGDVLGSFSTSRFGSRTAAEGLRQDELAFHTAVRGIMHALPWPVKRESVAAKSAANGKDKREVHKMFYPTSLKLWRRRDELQQSIDLFITKSLDGRLATSLPAREYTRSAAAEISQPGRMPVPSKVTRPLSNETETVIHTSISRSEMLLERLPYLARILPPPPPSRSESPVPLRNELEQITRFTGVGLSADDEGGDDEGQSAFAENRRRLKTIKRVAGEASDDELGVEKLALSEDDIEDDY
ncbi:MAG: Cell cycle checkpoint protein rad17 [Chrysothrix sp. TS-e1954]|nr:MAG: Cell cycle checkpoint protein rad17 [Chrysothrix sp. TS-e1954]